jgi:Crinkler effector protein N-terminal domain
MADDAPRALLCLIAGESSPFTVEPTGSTYIIDLKDLIKKKGKNGVLGRVLAKDLTLWKVRMVMASDSTANSLAG